MLPDAVARAGRGSRRSAGRRRRREGLRHRLPRRRDQPQSRDRHRRAVVHRGVADLRQPRRARREARGETAPRGVVGGLAGRADLHLQAQEGRQVARRQALHRARRRLHLLLGPRPQGHHAPPRLLRRARGIPRADEQGQPQEARGAGAEADRGRRRPHDPLPPPLSLRRVPRRARQPARRHRARARAAGSGPQHRGVQSQADRDGPLQVRRVEAWGAAGPRGQPRLPRRPPRPRPPDLPGDPGRGRAPAGAPGRRRRLHRAPTAHRGGATQADAGAQGPHRRQHVLHLLRVPPGPSSVRRHPRPACALSRRRRPRHRPRGSPGLRLGLERAVPAGELGLRPHGQALRVRSEPCQGAPLRGRLEAGARRGPGEGRQAPVLLHPARSGRSDRQGHRDHHPGVPEEGRRRVDHRAARLADVRQEALRLGVRGDRGGLDQLPRPRPLRLFDLALGPVEGPQLRPLQERARRRGARGRRGGSATRASARSTTRSSRRS